MLRVGPQLFPTLSGLCLVPTLFVAIFLVPSGDTAARLVTVGTVAHAVFR
eukprot:g12320.t1